MSIRKRVRLAHRILRGVAAPARDSILVYYGSPRQFALACIAAEQRERTSRKSRNV